MAKASGQDVQVVDPPMEEEEPAQNRLLVDCNTIPFYQLFRLISVLHKSESDFLPEELKGCTDVSSRQDILKLQLFTGLTTEQINQTINKRLPKFTQVQQTKFVEILNQIKNTDLNIASNYKKLQQLFHQLIPINQRIVKFIESVFTKLVNQDGTLALSIELTSNVIKEFIKFFDQSQTIDFSPTYYRENLFSLENTANFIAKNTFDFSEITLTNNQKNDLLQNVDLNQKNLRIPAANLNAFKGQVIVFSYVVKKKQSNEVIARGSQISEILDDPPTFELLENLDQILYVTLSDQPTVKKNYFEINKTYNLNWKLPTLSNVQQAVVMFGKYTDKPEPEIYDIKDNQDSHKSILVPSLQYGIAIYVSIVRVEILNSAAKTVKFGLIAIPYQGKACSTLLDPLNLKDVQNFDTLPQNKESVDNYFETLNQANQNKDENPPKVAPPTTGSKQKKGPELICNPEDEVVCNGHGTCDEDGGKYKCNCSATYAGKFCQDLQADFDKKVQFNLKVLEFVEIPSDKDGQIKAAQNVKEIVKSGGVDDSFLQAAKQKIVQSLTSVTTIEALASIIDTLSSIAQAKVEVAVKGSTKQAQQEGLNTVQQGLSAALKLKKNTQVDFEISVNGIKLKLVASVNPQSVRVLTEESTSFTSSKPDEVESSVAIIPSNHPLLSSNQVVFQIYEYSQFSGVEGAGFLLTPLTRIYFVSKANGEVILFDSTSPAIQLELFLTEPTQTGKTYEGVRLDKLGTAEAAFVTGITVKEQKIDSVVLEITQEGAYGIRIKEGTEPNSNDPKNEGNSAKIIAFVMNILMMTLFVN